MRMSGHGDGVPLSMLWSELSSGESERRGPMVARLFALALLAVPLGGCDTLMWWNKDEAVLDQPADRLYNEGLYLLNVKGDTKEAAKKFEEVDRQHPYSDWARKALIMSAYAHYQAGAYDDCISAARRYVQLHPGSP